MDPKMMGALKKLKSAMAEFEAVAGPNIIERDGAGDETTGPDLETVESSSTTGDMDKKAMVRAVMKKKMGM